MIAKYLVCVFISFQLCDAFSKGIPDYIKKCSLSAPAKEECYLKNGNAAIPFLLNGKLSVVGKITNIDVTSDIGIWDKKFNIPSFNPLLLDRILFAPGSNLAITFTNLKVAGFDGAKITTMEYDSGPIIRFTIEIPLLSIKGKYETKGRILLLPFEGTGPCDIKIFNGVYNVSTELSNMNFESKKPMKLVNSTINLSIEKTIYKFDELFNGNKQLGDEMNRFLNDNNKELEPDFQPVFAQTISTVIGAVLNGVLGKTYYADMFFP